MSHRIALVLALALVTLGASTAEAGRYHRGYGRHYHSRPHYYSGHHHHHHHHAGGHVGVLLYPHGLYLGMGILGNRVLHQDGLDASAGSGSVDLLNDGPGLSLYAGFRLHPRLALEAGWMGSVHDPEGTAFDDSDNLLLNGFTADARVYLHAASEGLEPYVQGGLGLYLLDNTYFGTQSVGTGFQLGGGFDWLLGSHFKLGLRALYRGMAMGPPNTGYTDTFVSSVTAEANLTFQF